VKKKMQNTECGFPVEGTFLYWLLTKNGVTCSSPSLIRFSLFILSILILYAVAAIGAGIPYLFISKDGQENSSLIRRLKKLFPNKSKSFYPVTELIITVFIGGLAGLILAEANTIRQAFISGLGWFGLVTTVSSSTGNQSAQSED
jgi:sterol desaturase/sphingolipid hydroxylase (fatty acid hydroxylase superfamily)